MHNGRFKHPKFREKSNQYPMIKKPPNNDRSIIEVRSLLSIAQEQLNGLTQVTINNLQTSPAVLDNKSAQEALSPLRQIQVGVQIDH
jgi:hypothetical protein